jgi:two-component system, OmpR family, response regulator
VSAVGTGSVRVLIVADDDAMGQEIFRNLRTKGYQAEGVHDGRQALARLQHEDFAAVVAELSVARAPDLDLVRAVQGLDGFRPWVMYTGAPDPFAARWREPRGVFCVLVKGAPVRDLVWSVEAACRAASRIARARCA